MDKYFTRGEALKQVSLNGSVYESLPKKLRLDEEIAREALAHGASFAYVPAELSNNLTFIKWVAENRLIPLDIEQEICLFAEYPDFVLNRYGGSLSFTRELQCELKYLYGDRFNSSFTDLNQKSKQDLESELHSLRVEVVRNCKRLYRQGKNVQTNHYTANGRYDLFIQEGAIKAREYGLPFSVLYRTLCDLKQSLESRVNRQNISANVHGSYPEKCVEAFLSSVGVEFFREVSFLWSKQLLDDPLRGSKKRYDFYLPAYETIIEVHGAQHYDGSFESLGGRSLEEERLNDEYKKSLALRNGIKHYITIDASFSDFEFIRHSITKNEELIKLFGITNFNWDSVGRFLTEESFSSPNTKFPIDNLKLKRLIGWLDAFNCVLTEEDDIALPSSRTDLSQQLRSEMARAQPNSSGLYPHEIIALSQAEHFQYPISIQNISGKWFTRYGIKNLGYLYETLRENGFLRLETFVEKAKTIKKSELIQLLKDLGIEFKRSSSKDELVDVINSNLTEQELIGLFPVRKYKLTNQGQEELIRNPYFNFAEIQQNFLSIWSLSRIIRHNLADPIQAISDFFQDPLSYQDDLNPAELKHVKRIVRDNKNILLNQPGSITFYSEAYSILAFSNAKKQAIDMLSLCMLGNLCETNIDCVRMAVETSQWNNDSLGYIRNVLSIPKGNMNLLKRLAFEADYDFSAIIEQFKKHIDNHPEACNVFSAKECFEIFKAELLEDESTLSTIYTNKTEELVR